MKFNLKFWAVLLALVTVLSTFVACGGPSSVTDAPETDAPDTTDTESTEPVETDAPETEPSETEPTVTEPDETEPPVEEPETPTEVLVLDFNTELPLLDYIASVEGTSANAKLKGGSVVDGKWSYDGDPLAFSDECGIFDLAEYSLEFDICFNSFVNKDDTSIFTFITDDDGVLGDGSVFYALKGDMDGKLYHFNQKDKAKQLEVGKVYNIRYDINRVTKKTTIYFDDTVWVSANFPLENNVYNCFRFLDNNRGAEVWIDNFIVTALSPVSDTSDTTAPEIDSPENDAPKTESGVVIENGVFKSATINFESDLSVVDYFAALEGFSVNDKLKGGEIVDGKWTYSGAALAFKDDCGIYDTDSFSLSFDICFNSFVTVDGASIFTFIVDDDGALGAGTVFYALKGDMDGKLYHFNQKDKAKQLEIGKVYNIKYEINRVTKKVTIYFDGTAWVNATFPVENNVYNCFRLVDNNKGADLWVDNITVTNLSQN